MFWFGLKKRVDELETHAFNLERVVQALVRECGFQVVLGDYYEIPEKEYVYNISVAKMPKPDDGDAK